MAEQGKMKSRTTRVHSATKAQATVSSGNRTSGTTVTNRARISGTRTMSGTRTVSGTRTFTGTRSFSGGSTVFVGSGFGYPYYGYGYGYPYSYGYYPYGYYPYGYSYGYDYYPSNYSYGYYQPRHGYNGSVVIQVQTRLARAGYYRGPIDGVMGPGTRFAIRAYERDHGLRVDGVISGPLMRNMGLRY